MKRIAIPLLLLLVLLAGLAFAQTTDNVTHFTGLATDEDITAGDDAIVTDDLSVGGDTTITGDLGVDDLDIGGTAYNSGGTLTLADNAQITGTLDVLGNVSDSGGTFTIDDAAAITGQTTIGGGYGDTGCTISAAGVLQCNGAATTDGAITADSATIGGGYGSTGASIANTGNLRTDGTVTIGAATGGAPVLEESGTQLKVTATGGMAVYNGATKIWEAVPGSDANLIAGQGHTVTSSAGVSIGGGITNTITAADYAIIAGGQQNTINDGDWGFIGGGSSNQCNADYATIAGGVNSTIPVTGTYAAIVGGNTNTASGSGSTIVGGASNVASGTAAVVLGGGSNYATALNSLAGAGSSNAATGESSIALGVSNTASATGAIAAGGSGNTASAAGAAALGGSTNTASGANSLAAGNTAAASGTSAVALGHNATASGNYSTAFGYGGLASGNYSTAFGNACTASGTYALAFGDGSQATKSYAFAGGRTATASHPGAFVWADSSSGAGFTSVATDTMTIRSTGGAYLTTGASYYLQVLTGNLKVGNKTPTATLDGEDAYIEGNLEVDGATRLDGALHAYDPVTIHDGVIITSTLDVYGQISDGYSDLQIDDNVDISGTIYDSKSALVLGDATQITGTLDVLGNVSDSGGTFTVADDVSITSDLAVAGPTSVGGGYGDTDGGCTATAKGNLSCDGNFTNDGSGTFGADVTLTADTTGGNAGNRIELIGIPRIALRGLGAGSNGAAGGKTVDLDDDSPAGEFVAGDGDSVCADDTSYFREGTTSLKLTFKTTADAGDGCHDGVAYDWTDDESLGFWLYYTGTLTAGDLVVTFTDNGGAHSVDVPAYTVANYWQWMEVDISGTGNADKDVISDVLIGLSAAGAARAAAGEFDVYVDAFYKWDVTEELAIGVVTIRDGILGVVDTIAGGTLVEYTDYFVHEELGTTYIVTISNQGASILMTMVAY